MTAGAQDVDLFVTHQLQQYPKSRLIDIYKSCFQDYMGAEHLVSDTAAVNMYMEQELATTDCGSLMPWYWEPCGVNGNYVRVSLRAVHEGYIPASVLVNAFIASANGGNHPQVEDWAARWHSIITVIDHMQLELPHYDEDKQLIEQLLARGRYAISHSPEYREAYAPHYRIVRRDIFLRDIAPLLPRPSGSPCDAPSPCCDAEE